MPRRKRKQMDDDWDDYQQPVDPADEPQQPADEPDISNVSLSDFYVKEKVSAFVRAYEPCREGDPGYEQLDEARLREIFKATVCTFGDTFKLYIEDLKMVNFHLEISMATGEPSLFVRRKQ